MAECTYCCCKRSSHRCSTPSKKAHGANGGSTQGTFQNRTRRGIVCFCIIINEIARMRISIDTAVLHINSSNLDIEPALLIL